MLMLLSKMTRTHILPANIANALYGGFLLTYVAFFLFFIPLPILLGMPFLNQSDRKPYPLLFSWVFGFLFLFAASYIPSLIGVFCDWPLDYAYYIWLCILVVAACFSLQYGFRHRKVLLPSKSDCSAFFKGISFLEILCVILVLFHAYVVFRYMHIDDDDSVYIAAATTSLDTNTVMRFNPMTGEPLKMLGQSDTARICVAPLHVLYASIARLFHLRPAALAHSYLPPILTILFYSCIALIGSVLFQKDRKKIALFTIFVYLVNICSYVSVYTSGTFLSIRSWQGKGIIVGALVPLVLWYYLYLIQKNGVFTFRDTLVLLLIYGTAGLATVMGMVLLCITGFLLMLFTLVKTRRPRIFLQYFLCMIFPAFATLLYLILSKQSA